MHRLDFQKRRDIPPVSPDDLRQALRQFASGVTVVTAEHAGERYGITVSAFTSISLEPPIIMVAINIASRLAPLIVEAEHFAVNILAAHQEELSARFASSLSGSEKYDGIVSEPRLSGAPIIEGALAVFDCVLDQTLLVGTHMLMFGRVVHAESDAEPGEPLIYYHRAYRRLRGE
jgi:flavin reductase